jgi:predicted membrane protein
VRHLFVHIVEKREGFVIPSMMIVVCSSIIRGVGHRIGSRWMKRVLLSSLEKKDMPTPSI